ncbi:MAG TPA: iron ABC transporter permease, partial [Spirochaetales bacterium]|nr:iron ABC transporter permease [Spirochaetales bacterium]
MSASFVSRSLREIRFLSKDPLLFMVVAGVLLSLIIFILYPLILVIATSFKTNGGYSLSVFLEVLKSRYLMQGFRNSVLMGTLTAVGGSILGYLFAFTLSRTDIPFKKFLHIIAIIPVVSPPFIGAMSIIMLFGNNG